MDITQDVSDLREELVDMKGRPEGSDWEESYAYSLGIQAYVWGFPWIYLTQLAWLWTSPEGKRIAEAKGMKLPWAPMNHFFNSPNLAEPGVSTGGSPNCDTLYSVAWIDLSSEPLVLSVPAVKNNYYTMEMFCLDSDNFAYVGCRSTGTEAGNYLLALPTWTGKAPGDVLDILGRARTPVCMILGRTGVNDGSEVQLAAARAIQSQYKLTPLSIWGREGAPEPPPPRAQVPVGIDYNDINGAWLTMNRAMTANPPGLPPGIDQVPLINLFATIGVGPGQRLALQSKATIRGLKRAAGDGLSLLKQMLDRRGTLINGWTYPPRDVGRAGQFGDYITRATVQALGGITANDPDEAVYLNTGADSAGRAFSSSMRYELNFDPARGGFPPIVEGFHGFWSVTLYQSDHNLVPGATAYTINNYDPKYEARRPDGGMTVLIQLDEPSNLSEGVYWLKSPPAGGTPNANGADFYLILRVYVPGPEVSMTQSWCPPTIRPIN